jgi:hypothetical protein
LNEKKHGGKRENAGRKTLGEEKKTPKCFKLKKETTKKINSMSVMLEVSQAGVVEQSVDNYFDVVFKK